MKSDLLEDLAKTGNVFISELKSESFLAHALELLEKMPVEQYTLEQWDYCLDYLFATNKTFLNYQEIRQYIENHLKEKGSSS